MLKRFVIYRRISSQLQRDGYSLDAQLRAVESYLKSLTCPYDVVGTFDEQETGANDERPKLKEAIKLAQATDATIVIARLDRIGRSLPLLYILDRAKVSFCAADNPNCDAFSSKLMMLFAERERELIASRVKAALQVAKSRGVKLGSKTPMIGLKIAWRAKQERATAYAERMAPVVKQIQKAGCVSLRQITVALNARGIKSPNGKEFKPQTVADLLKRTGLKP